MNKNSPGYDVDNTSAYAEQNDIQSLRRAFSLPKLDYADILQREHLAAAIKRWPLLAEMADKQ
ncbi:cellulose biosynthesis protein BcsR [Entomohabitans teleogrylli]|uniref:cellulose biosynthesis protein BcsR n=1 Tax=Entomohabitans teleogrylli TaxID=1384589 RepID=UPI00073DA0DA|nr:cellulose biosynthesis protein BcsR [Entomohabitans teleogrylli]